MTPQADLHDSAADLFLDEVLGSLNKAKSKGLILNMGNIDVVDSFMSRTIGELIQVASLLGVKAVVTGLRPEVAITLVERRISIDQVNIAQNLDQALALINQEGF